MTGNVRKKQLMKYSFNTRKFTGEQEPENVENKKIITSTNK